jgi:PAS domain S-box-containing protein
VHKMQITIFVLIVCQSIPYFFFHRSEKKIKNTSYLIGILVGLGVVFYTYILPYLIQNGLFSSRSIITGGPANMRFLRPSALFGFTSFSPFFNTLMMSLALNSLFFICSVFVLRGPTIRQRYAKILRQLKIEPEELTQKIDYFQERDKLLTKHAHVLKKHVDELKKNIELRQRVERELLKYTRAVNQSPSMVVITDLDGNIVYVNPKFTQVTGYRPDEVIGKNPRILKSGKQGPDVYEQLWKTITTGGEWRGEFSNLKKNKELYWESASISAIRDSKGKIINYLAVKEDITLRKKAQEELLQAKNKLEIQTWGLQKTNNLIQVLYRELAQKNDELLKLDRMKSDFISTVSHELRTPLTIIREGVSQINDGILGAITPEQREFLVLVLSNIDRLARMINDLLDMSKIESGKEVLEKTQFDIRDLIDEVKKTFLAKAERKNIELRASIHCENNMLYADKDKITQVFTNLVANALKFTDSGHIDITATEREHSIECSVQDTGRGIAPENIPKLFNKFQQFARLDGLDEKGTGLGLSIVKGIIGIHNGNIWATSTLGSGSKFTFTIPKQNHPEPGK